MEIYRQAVDLDPQLRAVCRDTRQFAGEEDRSLAILENCRHILARYPNYAPAHYSMACALLNLGRVVEACRASERALVIDATVPTYYHVLIHAGNPKQITNAVSAMEQLVRHEASLDPLDRATLHFLLAKACDDPKRTDDAFVHLEKANAIKRKLVNYDEAQELGRMQATMAAFTPQRIESLRGSGPVSQRPVFVVGMPRSGTTLIEQILASHPDVRGAGETTTLPDLVAQGLAGRDFPTSFDTVTDTQLLRLGEAYLARLAALAPGAKHIVDKLPYNFLKVGLIHLALPGARIIHVQRDALDTCFSCFQQTFAGDVGFAYDLGELGRYYKAYEALMAHWRRVLPDGAMLEVQYEDLVNDLPVMARRMIEYCGLEWDARCLEFHKNPRAVATASLYQVRQPIYMSAIGRAQAYYAHLAPLREALA
jgi:tetratricopeptide (TPR) repeat protein